MEKKPGLLRRMLRGVARYAKHHVVQILKSPVAAAEKLIPQGAAEIAQGLYSGHAFVAYGPTEQPVPMTEKTAKPRDYEAELANAAKQKSKAKQKEAER